ncbi:MAG: alpha/beta hydrolase [Acidimicrobiales bacterium]
MRLAVRRWVPDRPAGTTVVLVHGFGATKDDRSVVAVAERLRGDGHHVVSYTARGHGESDGLCTLGDLEHLDVEAAVLMARRDADSVVLVGASMGAIAVLRHASHVAPDGVVTVSSPAEWRLPRTAQSVGAAMLTQTSPGRWVARRLMNVRLAGGWSGASSPVELAASIDAPLAVVHGSGDRFIRPAEAEKLYRAASGRRQLSLVDGMGHAYAPESVAVIGRSVRWALTAEAPTDISA